MIRKMKPSDWKQVEAIYTQALEKGISTFNQSCPSYEQWDQDHLSGCRYVFEEDGQIAGWIALSPVSRREAYKGCAEMSIYIREKDQRKGIGSRLIRHLFKEAEANGFWCIQSTVFCVNPASLALHEKTGFRKVGYRERIARDRFGNWQDTILFEKRL